MYNKLQSFQWYPKFNNSEQLKGNLEWHETNILSIAKIEPKIAWSFMPEDMKVYLKSLPEYDEEIFNKVVGM